METTVQRILSAEPADFTTNINNPFFPVVPGQTLIYRGLDGEEVQRDVWHVTRRTKVIAGVTCRVVLDIVYSGGQMKERTLDWYAQDNHGNVWYFGEETAEYENGQVVSTAGSWEHGVNGALAGLMMPALGRRAIGDTFYQEYLEGEAEDQATLLAVNATADVIYANYEGCLKFSEFSRLNPGVVDEKYYARGVGLVYSEKVSGGVETLELRRIAAGLSKSVRVDLARLDIAELLAAG